MGPERTTVLDEAAALQLAIVLGAVQEAEQRLFEQATARGILSLGMG